MISKKSITTKTTTVSAARAACLAAICIVMALSPAAYGQGAQESRPATAPAAAEADDSYVFGPDDLISINVFGVPELNTRVRVSGQGTITLPLIGEVKVSGLTAAKLENYLAEILEKQYLKNPQVSVFINEYQSRKISVLGAVVTPGSFEMRGRETLLQAISQAGGLTPQASGRVIVISGESSQVIDLDELMNTGAPRLNVPLKPGDIVNIPHERYVDVYVFGEVRRPGSLQVKKSGDLSILKAIAQAGGFTERASKSGVVVRRKTGGKEVRFKVNVNNLISGEKPPFILQQDDIIYIPESLF